MDKKTILRVFGEAFLRSMVVLMAVAIIGFSAFFIIKVNSDKKKLAENPTTEVASTYSDEELQARLEAEDAAAAAEAEAEAEEEELTTEEITEEATTEEPDISSKDKSVLVLNSTGVAGLAKAWMTKLTGEGFAKVATGNYSLSRDAQTKIYVSEEGMGKDLAAYFKDPIIEVGTLSSGIDVSTTGVEVFIVLGSNDTTVQ